MSVTFRVTFTSTTPESAEACEYSDLGYICPRGWTSEHDPEGLEWSLREVVQSFKDRIDGDCGEGLYTASEVTDYSTGESTAYCLHRPEGITDASWNRVRALIGL